MWCDVGLEICIDSATRPRGVRNAGAAAGRRRVRVAGPGAESRAKRASGRSPSGPWRSPGAYTVM